MDQLNPAAPVPNAEQEAAADAFFQFLFSKDKEFNISGPGGTGKTFLMGHLIDEVMVRYHDTCKMMGIPPTFTEVVMTATTNKAAEVLSLATGRPTDTIHSFLNLKVTEDFKTGRTKLTKTRSWVVHENKIVFVDECSMIDSDLYFMLHAGTQDCKIVYVGDHCQLAPVMEVISPVYRNNIQFCELTRPMRNANQPALMDVCQQLRETVETGEFKPIRLSPGVIDLMDDDQIQDEIAARFSKQTLDHRILAYTNERVIAFNQHIRDMRQLPAHPVKGEFLVNNSAIRLKNSMLSVEEEVEIIRIADQSQKIQITPDVEMEIRLAHLQTRGGNLFTDVPLPADQDHFRELVRYFGRQKQWDIYFELKQKYPDLRQRDAGTVYKAQGSTYDSVIIDLGNISTCHNSNQVARMLYVAFSRARKRVVLFGQLAEKYGGVMT